MCIGTGVIVASHNPCNSYEQAKKDKPTLFIKFMGPGRTQAEADTLALDAAKAFHAKLVREGFEPTLRDSEVRGVRWKRQKLC